MNIEKVIPSLASMVTKYRYSEQAKILVFRIGEAFVRVQPDLVTLSNFESREQAWNLMGQTQSLIERATLHEGTLNRYDGGDEMSRTKVLFLCTGNSARSQMAEALLRKYGDDRFEAHSAGHEPKGINPLTIKVMEEIGIDMSGHRSKSLDEYMGKEHFGYLISVCADADKRCPIFPGISARLRWFLNDPAAYEGTEEEKLSKFREVRDQIQARIEEWLDKDP